MILTTLATIPYMCKKKGNKGGLIVNVASVLGLEPGSFIATYTSTKHGVIGWTRCMAVCKTSYSLVLIERIYKTIHFGIDQRFPLFKE